LLRAKAINIDQMTDSPSSGAILISFDDITRFRERRPDLLTCQTSPSIEIKEGFRVGNARAFSFAH
jgi:hypothetical protein